MISLLFKLLPIFDITLGLFLSFLTLMFLIRLIMTWYPNIDSSQGLWIIVKLPTNMILRITKQIVPPIGGVDITPVIWIGLISFLREILVGQQGLIKLVIHSQMN